MIGHPIMEVLDERARQDEKRGEQNHPDGTGSESHQLYSEIARAFTDKEAEEGRLTWAAILDEEFAEVMAEADIAKLRTELIQLAAVAVAWVEAIDRRVT